MPTRGEAQGSRVRKADTPATQPATASDKKKVQKLPLTEKVNKFLDRVSPDTKGAVHELIERTVQGEDGNKNNLCFVVFSDGVDPETVNNDANVKHIKDCLFLYHTEVDNTKGGKKMLLSVMAPETEEDVHILCIQEI